MVNLEIKDLTKVYNKKTVLDNISFEVKNGEFLSILGPSGCGKTTLLKILIGIENPTSGRILKKEKDITKLDSSKRGMGIVFQNYALFPNMTVLDNVMYALNLKLKNKASGAKTVPKRNSCECLLFTGVIFLPAFDLFDLFSTFRITMILQLQTYCFHNLLSGFIIKLIE